MDVFKKCGLYTTANDYKSKNLYPYFRPINSAQDTEVNINNTSYLMLGSNSYMGLTNHPEVKEAAIKAIEKYGSGNAGSRFLNGTLDIHDELEHKLAQFANKEAGLLYGTGWMTNVGVLSTLIGPQDVIFCDRMNHASIIDGARLSLAKKVVKYKHNNMEDLEQHVQRVLSTLGDVGLFIISDGIFSMEGDIVDLPNLVKIAKKYNARILIDDAHSVGVLGSKGQGTSDHFNLTQDVDLIMYTFSKSLASLGGVILGEKTVIDYLKHNSRPVIFSASIPPSAVAAVSKALDIIVREPERMKRLWEITHKMSARFKEMGFEIGVSQTPIIPILTGSMDRTFQFWRELTDIGIFVNPVVSPAVPEGQGLIRTSYMATHTDSQLEFALEQFQKIGKKLKVI